MVPYPKLAKLVLSYRWHRGWHYWNHGSKRAALGQWRRLPQGLGWSSGETYFQLSQELRVTLSDAAGDTCEQWSRQRGWRSPELPSFHQPSNPPSVEPESDSEPPSIITQKSLEQACQDNPDQPEPWIELGNFYKANQQYAEAADAYLKAVEAGGPDQPYQNWYNLFYLKIPEAARPSVIQRHQVLAERYPHTPGPVTNLGKLLSMTAQPEEAIAAHREASRRCIQQRYGGTLPPAWDDNGTLTPGFLIVGVQKCGTSSFYAYLSEHPQMLPSVIKEIYFFSHHDRYKFGLPWYLAHFPRLTGDHSFITGEASPNYFDNPDVPQRIAEHFPEIKLIILLRNPADRFISHYQHWRRQGYDTRPRQEAIATALEQWRDISPDDIQAHQAALEKRGENHHNYFYRSLYAHHLEQQWLKHFSKEQLLVLTLEEMAQSPQRSLDQTFQFLGLSDFQLADYPTLNKGQYAPQSDPLQLALADAFIPHTRRLETLLNRTFPWS